MFIVIGLALSFLSRTFLEIYILGLGVYLLALFTALVDISHYEKNILVNLNAVYYIFLTHLVYGYNFLKGFIFTNNLKSKLR